MRKFKFVRQLTIAAWNLLHNITLSPSIRRLNKIIEFSPKKIEKHYFHCWIGNWIPFSQRRIAFMLRTSVKILVNDITVNDLCQFMVMSSEIEFRVLKSHQNRFLRSKLCDSASENFKNVVGVSFARGGLLINPNNEPNPPALISSAFIPFHYFSISWGFSKQWTERKKTNK